jgi:hypothetical protein
MFLISFFTFVCYCDFVVLLADFQLFSLEDLIMPPNGVVMISASTLFFFVCFVLLSIAFFAFRLQLGFSSLFSSSFDDPFLDGYRFLFHFL